ncbi:MAG: ABC transporter ATP-binding protein [Merismopedia sp. SIO2A8]|nr:ABC transporter ATP-binding protein [Symploca sp. SIO2B6]NET49903.1 ABC transporter ATP-binding protein [Merismopedia sp. SIO2A8]
MTYLRLEGITKHFGNFIANYNINLSIEGGTIHALLGENGAGKTTLMNILCGLYTPDHGQIFLQERPVKITSPRVAIEQGIGMIHQHFMLVPELSVTENIILGTQLNWRLNLSQKAKEITAISKSYNLEVEPLAKVRDLPVGIQQRVEILKALYRQAKLLILDEPTAVLTPPEVESLFAILRQLSAAGQTIIFISHKLEEVMQLCQTVTVLRGGKVVAQTTTRESTRQELAELMVGRKLLLKLDKSSSNNPYQGQVILEVNQLQVKDERQLLAVNDVSFQLHSGEILGVAGVDGNGQRELADAIAGLRPVTQGQIKLCDPSASTTQDITNWPPHQRVKLLKIGYIPEDRQTMGLVIGFSLAKNLILKVFKYLPFCRRWCLQHQAINNHADAAIQKFDIRAEDSGIKVSQLSGGNQQKVVLAREISGEPTLIIAMQPTRGLDLGATEYVQQCLLAQRARGAAILYISTELEEVIAMSDRIAVIYKGKIVNILDNYNVNIQHVGYLMTVGL